MFRKLEKVFQAQDGAPEAGETDILVTLIEAYEYKHYPISAADPVKSDQIQDGATGLPKKNLSHTWAQEGV